jgi:hypothetical protein
MDFNDIEREEIHYPCGSNKVSCYPVEVLLPAGVYQFECYGASGGISGNGNGGYGAYVSGNINLNSNQRMLLFIGARGHTTDWQYAFNGGGRGKLSGGGSSGGGSTDIRLINSTGLDGLVSRIIVAGAGGGGVSWSSGANGGNGGIFTGEDGKIATGSSGTIEPAKGGGVSSGGDRGLCVSYSGGSSSCNHHGSNGGFGFGGDGYSCCYGGGGGSGYFGGGGGAEVASKVGSGAGGSSYVSGHYGFHTFKVENGQLKDTLTENHSSGFVFYNVTLKSGSEIRYVGDGKVIITRINLTSASYKNPLHFSCRDQFNDYCYIFYTSIMVLLS